MLQDYLQYQAGSPSFEIGLYKYEAIIVTNAVSDLTTICTAGSDVTSLCNSYSPMEVLLESSVSEKVLLLGYSPGKGTENVWPAGLQRANG